MKRKWQILFVFQKVNVSTLTNAFFSFPKQKEKDSEKEQDGVRSWTQLTGLSGGPFWTLQTDLSSPQTLILV